MKCKKVQKLIVAYLDNELSARKQNALQSHLAQCPVCSTELESYKKLNGIIETLPKLEGRSPIYWQNQVASIERKVAEVKAGKAPEPAVKFAWPKPVWQKFAVATATIAIAAIVLLVNLHQQPMQTLSPTELARQPMITEKASQAEPETKEFIQQPTLTGKPSRIDEIKKKDIELASKLATPSARTTGVRGKEEKITGTVSGPIFGKREVAVRGIVAAPIPAAPVLEEMKVNIAKEKMPEMKAAAVAYLDSTIPASTSGSNSFGRVIHAGDTVTTGGMGFAACHPTGRVTPAKAGVHWIPAVAGMTT
ncbi:MAG: zf-HC2 domain-containing protein, partial [bacterium]|nr:zf-HC2 domain-containing protein [bacterium]